MEFTANDIVVHNVVNLDSKIYAILFIAEKKKEGNSVIMWLLQNRHHVASEREIWSVYLFSLRSCLDDIL